MLKGDRGVRGNSTGVDSTSHSLPQSGICYTKESTLLDGHKKKRCSLLLWPERGWKDNIEMNLGEIGWEDVNEIYLASDRDLYVAVGSMALNFRVS
jgi:hypothetical protein